MSRRKCCCVLGCTIYVDDFDDTASDTLSSNWDEDTNWRYTGSTLKEDGNSGSLCICTVPHHKNKESMVVLGNTFNENTGDKLGVIVNYKDHSNYHEAVLDVAGGSSTLSLYSVTGAGGRVLLTSDTVGGLTGTSRTISVCIAEGMFSASVNPPGFWDVWTTNVSLITGGIYSGLSNRNASDIEFTDFQFIEHYVTNPDCPQCRCWCEGTPVPQTLTLTYWGTAALACGNGGTITLTWDRTTDDWQGSGTIAGITWDFTLTCGGSDLSNWSLTMQPNSCDSGTLSMYSREADSTCDPFDIWFGPWQIGELDLACGACGRLSACWMDEELIERCPGGTYEWELTL